MAKKRKQKDRADVVSDLLELAEKVNLPEGAFDGDIEDECDNAAQIMAESMKNSLLVQQLEFLLDHGYKPERLAELVREYGVSNA